MTEDEMVGWDHRLNGHEFKQALGDGEGQESLACCSPWGCKEVVATETNTFIFYLFLNIYLVALGVSYIMWDLFSCGMWDLVPR